MSYENTLLNLKPYVAYVGLTDPQMGTMAKIIDISNRAQYKANNKTSALLLYLLRRDHGDEIHFNTLKDRVKQKYGLSDADATAKLNAFLTKMDGYRILASASAGNFSGTNSPDPLNLFLIPESWDVEPDLIQGDMPVCRATHYYSTGYGVVTIRR
jgi:hypothetical protein